MIRWKDNNKSWSNEHWVSIKNTGDTNFIARLSNLGIYETRQYEFVYCGNTPWTLVEAEEDVEVLQIQGEG